MAYIAVGFQGLAGALFFSVIPFFRLAACLFGMIALFESAVQKFLVTTLIFGKSVWEALDSFVASMLKDLSVFNEFSFSIWLVATYTGVYIIWGLILGWWSSGLPKVLHEQSEHLILSYSNLDSSTNTDSIPVKKKFGFKLMATFFILVFIVTVFAMQGSGGKVWYALGRTIGALLILFYILNPVIKSLMNRWLKQQQQDKATEFTSVLNSIPELRSHIAPAMQLARAQHKGMGVYKAFVTNLIVFTLYK